MQKAISTQEELTAFKNALELLASNLSFHVNSALGKAHGVELYMGYVDADGNDLRLYYDSYGNLISGADPTLPNFIRWVIDGVPYYTPIQYADPGAQSATTGAIQSPTAIVPTGGPENTSLITDYVSYETPAAQGMNDYILGHANLTHQVAHTAQLPMTAVHSPVYDAAGAEISDYRVRLNFKGYTWEVPANTRLGGPVQPLRISGGYVPNYIHSADYHGTGTPNPDTAVPGTIVGTKPYSLVMEYWTGSTWANMLPTYPPNVNTYVPAYVNGHGPIPILWSDTTGSVKVFKMPSGSNATSKARMRLSVFQSTTNTTTVVGILDIQMTELDPGSCFFFKSALDFSVPDFLMFDLKDEFYSARCRRGYKWMTYWGVPLMDRSRAWFQAVRYGIVQPFLWWGAFRYRRSNRFGWLCGLYCRAWIAFWNFVGLLAQEPPNPPGWRERQLNILRTRPRD